MLFKKKKVSFRRLCKQIQTCISISTLNLAGHDVRCHFSDPRVRCGSLSSWCLYITRPCGRRYQIRGIPAKPLSGVSVSPGSEVLLISCSVAVADRGCLGFLSLADDHFCLLSSRFSSLVPGEAVWSFDMSVTQTPLTHSQGLWMNTNTTVYSERHEIYNIYIYIYMKSSFPKRDKRQIKKKMSSSCHFAVYWTYRTAPETRVRDPLGVMVRTRGGFNNHCLTCSDWANRSF